MEEEETDENADTLGELMGAEEELHNNNTGVHSAAQQKKKGKVPRRSTCPSVPRSAPLPSLIQSLPALVPPYLATLTDPTLA